MSIILPDSQLRSVGILFSSVPSEPDYILPFGEDDHLSVFLEPDHVNEVVPIETIVVCLTDSFGTFLPKGGFGSGNVPAIDQGFLRLRFMYEAANLVATVLKITHGLEASCEIHQPGGYDMTEAHVRIIMKPTSLEDVGLLVKFCKMAHSYLHNPAPELIEHLLVRELTNHLTPLKGQLTVATQSATAA